MSALTKPFAKRLLAHLARLDAGESLDGGEVGALLKELTARELEEGGPYALSHGGRKADVGLNLAIACVLRALEVDLPKLDAYLDVALAKGERDSAAYDGATVAALALRYRKSKKYRASAAAVSGTAFSEDEQRMMDKILGKAGKS